VDQKQVALGYDAASRLSSISEHGSGNSQAVAEAGYTYDHLSRLTALSWNGYSTTLGSSGYGGTAGVVSYEEFSWAYDNGSRVAYYGNATYSGESQTYSYNHDSELGGAVGDGGSYQPVENVLLTFAVYYR
jgi:hypothetical protein